MPVYLACGPFLRLFSLDVHRDLAYEFGGVGVVVSMANARVGVGFATPAAHLVVLTAGIENDSEAPL